MGYKPKTKAEGLGYQHVDGYSAQALRFQRTVQEEDDMLARMTVKKTQQVFLLQS